MDVFVENRIILECADAKRIIKNYNQLSKVLFSYEMLYHRAWLRQIDVLSTGIHSSILICADYDDTSSVITFKTEKNPNYLVNFDPNVLELIRETQCLTRLGLDVSNEASSLVQQETRLKGHYQNLKELLIKNQNLRAQVQPPFEALLMNKLNHLNNVIKPGLVSLTWTSLTIDDYVNTVNRIILNTIQLS